MSDIRNSTSSEANLSQSNPADAIAKLLMGDGDAEAAAPELDENPAEAEALTDEPTETEYEPSDQEEPDDSQDQEQAAASEEEESLAVLLGLKEDLLIVDDEGNISIKTKINGKEGKVDLPEMLKGFQFNQANNEKAQKLASERKAFEVAKQEEQARIQQQLQQAEGLALMWQNELMSGYQNVDWGELRRLDPGEFAAKQAEFQQRQQKLQQVGQYMSEYHQQQEAKAQEEHNQRRAQQLAEQRSIMLQNNPAWNDDGVFEKEMGDLRSFVQSQYGFTESDVDQVSDARLIELIKDAHAFRSGESVKAKRSKPVPPKLQRAANGRFMKPKKQKRLDKLVNAAKQAKGANKREIEKDAVAALLLGEN